MSHEEKEKSYSCSCMGKLSNAKDTHGQSFGTNFIASIFFSFPFAS